MEEGKKENSIYFYIFFQTFIYFKYLNLFYLVVFNFSLHYFERFRYADRQSVKQKKITQLYTHMELHTYTHRSIFTYVHLYFLCFKE